MHGHRRYGLCCTVCHPAWEVVTTGTHVCKLLPAGFLTTFVQGLACKSLWQNSHAVPQMCSDFHFVEFTQAVQQIGAKQMRKESDAVVFGSPEGLTLNRERLTTLLEAFGEYPAKYRRAVW